MNVWVVLVAQMAKPKPQKKTIDVVACIFCREYRTNGLENWCSTKGDTPTPYSMNLKPCTESVVKK